MAVAAFGIAGCGESEPPPPGDPADLWGKTFMATSLAEGGSDRTLGQELPRRIRIGRAKGTDELRRDDGCARTRSLDRRQVSQTAYEIDDWNSVKPIPAQTIATIQKRSIILVSDQAISSK